MITSDAEKKNKESIQKIESRSVTITSDAEKKTH